MSVKCEECLGRVEKICGYESSSDAFCTEHYIEHLEQKHGANRVAQDEAQRLRRWLKRAERGLQKHLEGHDRDAEERELVLWISAHAAAFTAKCNDCSTTESLNAEDNQRAACGFYESGWRVRGGRMRCKQHAAPLQNEGTRYLKKDMGVWLD